MTRDKRSWSGSGLLETERKSDRRGKEVAAARLTSFLPQRRIQETPYIALERNPLAACMRENAFSWETSIKMSVLAARRSPSFHP